MLPLPAEIQSKYPSLPLDVIYGAIEIATIRAVSSIYGCPATAIIEDSEIHVMAYIGLIPTQIDISKLRKRNKRRLLDEIELELTTQQTIFETKELASLRGSLVTGRVDRLHPDGKMDVLIEMNDGLRPIYIYAEYPIQQQPRHERGNYIIGHTYSFLVASCLPVSNGKAARVRTIVSRVSRELPSKMLAKLTGLSGIKCSRRISGGYCDIKTSSRIPKLAINEVGKELREHIYVNRQEK